MDITKLITVRQYADANDVSYASLRKLAKSGSWADAHLIGADENGDGGTWYVERDVPVPDIPEPKKRTRTDGRTRWIVYVNDAELSALKTAVPSAVIIDPRELAKQRRARKHAIANATDDTTDGDGIPLAPPRNGAALSGDDTVTDADADA